MRIGIDASRANRNLKTGTEWYSYYLIINLIKIDKENEYILYSDQPLSQAFLNDLDLINNKHVRVKVLRWPFNYFWTLGRLSLEMLLHRPRVLFVPAHALPLFFPKRTINTIHDLAFIKEEKLYSDGFLFCTLDSSTKGLNFLIKILTFGRYCFKSSDYLKWSTKFALRRSRKIISVSQATKEDILKYYPRVKEEKIAVIHNGYNDKLYKKINNQTEVQSILEKYGINFPYFLYVGRLERKKNIYNLVEAYSIFKESYDQEVLPKLVLIGSAGFGYDEIKYMIEELGLENDLIIPGWVEEEDLPALFNAAKIFIFPSLYEGFGIPILQAMACGVPVISSDIEVLREVAGDAALFFNRLDPDDLAEKIKELNNNDQLRQDFINKGLSRSNNFSWLKCAQKTLEEIKKL